jgi:outer membrane protein OmpA-like peptidoglycan-associated protein
VVAAVSGDPRGDYETVVAVASATARELVLVASAEVQEGGRSRRLTVERRVGRADLSAARVQVLGFQSSDPAALPGTTALGPSLAVVRELRTTGRAEYGVKNYAGRATSAGTIARVEAEPVPFPVLLNGRRTVLPAIHAAGRLRYAEGERPWDLYILDHPDQPLLLKVAYGALGGPPSAAPEWSRQVVRIDLLEPAAGDGALGGAVQRSIEAALATECRVEMPGIYFEFNSATLNPQSEPALRSLAALLRRRAEWRVGIEGHTDSVGGDAYNVDLSARRADAVREALAGRFAIAPARLTSAGHGESRPREPNATPEGRARNRRVEVVRPCAGTRP